MRGYIFLIISIAVIWLSGIASKYSDGLRIKSLAFLNIVLFLIGIYLFSVAVTEINMAIAYASWSGVSIVISALTGWLLFKEIPGKVTILGIVVIIAGVIMMNC